MRPLTQLSRFVRIFVFALVPALIALSTSASKYTIAAVIAVAAPAAETAWRQVFPAVPITKPPAPAPPPVVGLP